jgi:hypothetical protein
MRVAVVTWNDAHVVHGDVMPNDIDHEPILLHTAGWLIRDDDVGITLAFEYADEDGELRTTTFIPRGMIVSVSERYGER